MRRVISTPFTISNKIIGWIMYIIFFQIFWHFEFDVTTFETWMFAAIFTIFGVYQLRRFFNYKKIEMDKNGLFISQKRAGHKIEIFVPFTDIKNVKRIEGIKGNAKKYILELKDSTRFGSKISFNPISKWAEFPENMIINELNDKIRVAKSPPKLKMQNP